MTRDEAIAGVPMLRAALAEAGFPNAWVVVGPNYGDQYSFDMDPTVPRDVAYRAFCLVALSQRRQRACWECWAPSQGHDRALILACRDGNCPHEQVSA